MNNSQNLSSQGDFNSLATIPEEAILQHDLYRYLSDGLYNEDKIQVVMECVDSAENVEQFVKNILEKIRTAEGNKTLDELAIECDAISFSQERIAILFDVAVREDNIPAILALSQTDIDFDIPPPAKSSSCVAAYEFLMNKIK